ncbi:MAG: single-stranded DNA-binding protein [Clostridia bacterium]|nr:single-stranded DNA-binding protein [Clostridia bacterium]
MNKVYLIGNLTKDPEVSETSSGVAVARLSIAVNRDYLEDGERNADFFKINVWRGQAENCEKYLKKGSKIAVLGSLHNRSYDDKDGNRKTVTEITASEVEFLSSIRSEEAQTPEQLRLEEVSEDEPLPF